MKSRFKKIAVAIAAIMTIGSLTLVSCDKEEGNSNSNNPSLKTYTNPYSYIGEWHNTAMYDVGLAIQDSLDYYASIGTLTITQKNSLIALIIEKISATFQSYSTLQIPTSTLNMIMNYSVGS